MGTTKMKESAPIIGVPADVGAEVRLFLNFSHALETTMNNEDLLRYAIIGSGEIGTAIARGFARKGITVAIASSRGLAAVLPIVDQLGPSIVACSIPAALDADVIIFAEPFSEETKHIASRRDWIPIEAPGPSEFSSFAPANEGSPPLCRCG
jgi:hypothetical protein